MRDGLADLSLTVDGYGPRRVVITQVAELLFLGDSAGGTSLAHEIAA
jgi:TRAP-type transport system periplasmic protein